MLPLLLVILPRTAPDLIRRITATLALVSVAAALSAAEVRRDVEYQRAGGVAVHLDAHLPDPASQPAPIAILVHGGGWTGGDKAGDILPLIEPLTAAGFVCLSIDYRLAPEFRWPACLEDVLAAVRWTKANAASVGGDPSRIALIGYSAGGHLVTYASTVVDDTVRVQAVVGLAPLTDFVQELPMRGNILGRAQRGLLDRPQEITPESLGLLRALSPVNHLRAGLPPYLLIHGDADRSVPYVQSVTFQEMLQAEGVPCELITLPGAPHRLAEWPDFQPDLYPRLVGWLQRTLLREAPASH